MKDGFGCLLHAVSRLRLLAMLMLGTVPAALVLYFDRKPTLFYSYTFFKLFTHAE